MNFGSRNSFDETTKSCDAPSSTKQITEGLNGRTRTGQPQLSGAGAKKCAPPKGALGGAITGGASRSGPGTPLTPSNPAQR